MLITIKVVSSNPVHGEVYSIQHYVINSSVRFILWQLGGFLRVLWFPPPIKLTQRYSWNGVESVFKQYKPTILQMVSYLIYLEQFTSELIVRYIVLHFHQTILTMNTELEIYDNYNNNSSNNLFHLSLYFCIFKPSCNNVVPVTNLCLGRATKGSHSSQWSKQIYCSWTYKFNIYASNISL